MNHNEIVKALRLCGETSNCEVERVDCPYCENTDDCKNELMFDAADLIESLRYDIGEAKAVQGVLANNLTIMSEKITAAKRKAETLRNELCLKCGKYKQAHKGACNGCRFKED